MGQFVGQKIVCCIIFLMASVHIIVFVEHAYSDYNFITKAELKWCTSFSCMALYFHHACFVLFCFVLFAFVLFGFVLFYLVLFCSILHGYMHILFGYRSINECNDCICHRHRAQAVPLSSFALYHTCQGTTILFALCVLWVKLSQDKLYSLRGCIFMALWHFLMIDPHGIFFGNPNKI